MYLSASRKSTLAVSDLLVESTAACDFPDVAGADDEIAEMLVRTSFGRIRTEHRSEHLEYLFFTNVL
jgi:hypothetical protein